MTCFAFRSKQANVDTLAVADAMEELGWKLERQQLPPTVHCSVMPHHLGAGDKFLADLRTAVDRVLADPQVRPSIIVQGYSGPSLFNHTGTFGMRLRWRGRISWRRRARPRCTVWSHRSPTRA